MGPVAASLKVKTLNDSPYYMEQKKKKILLHDQRYSIGGPKVVLDGIRNSYLKEQFDFVTLEQTEACGFNPIKAIRFVIKYRKLINQEKADAIYICGLQYTGLLMTIASKLSNVKKVVLSVHGSDWDNPDGTLRKWILMHIVEPLEIKLADSVFTVCEAAQKTIKPLRRCRHNDGVVYNTFPDVDYSKIPSGTIRKELGIGDDKIIVTSVGRVVKAKGHDYVIEAIKHISDNRFVFVVVGDGPYVDEYQKRCNEEIARGQVFLLGKRTDVYSILKDSDIFLFATLNENHSIALLEAVNMKCCALCTNVGGNPEIIENNESGILIPKCDSNAIIKGLYFLENEKLRKIYAQKAYDMCRDKFSIENTYGILHMIFNR